MRHPEQRLWDNMRGALGKRCRLERIENLVGVGTPDVWVLTARHGIVTPVELKAVRSWPVRGATPVLGREGLSPEQRNWHLDWHRWGGRSLVIVGVGTEGPYAFDGKRADSINQLTKHEYVPQACAIGWERIFEVMSEN